VNFGAKGIRAALSTKEQDVKQKIKKLIERITAECLSFLFKYNPPDKSKKI
jgi:hypothetical protein